MDESLLWVYEWEKKSNRIQSNSIQFIFLCIFRGQNKESDLYMMCNVYSGRGVCVCVCDGCNRV